MKLNMTIKKIISLLVIAGGISWGCQAVVEDLTGPSSLGNNLGIVSQPNTISIGGGSTTISVTVFTVDSIPVEGATVTLTSTLGTLGAASLTTNAGGGATTTLTPGTISGLAYVTASIDNITAVTAVSIIN
ncbi:MAG: Ig-like domain-containing protein [Nitrospinaceae bacterium]|nr:Ig-like domain-containing protein [Nitrospinaceae bacterium]